MTPELILQLFALLLFALLVYNIRLKSKNDELSLILEAVQETRNAEKRRAVYFYNAEAEEVFTLGLDTYVILKQTDKPVILQASASGEPLLQKNADLEEIYTLLLNIENEIAFLEARLNKDC